MNFMKINKKVWIVSAIALVVFVSFAFVLIQKSSKGGSGDEIYYCPMHPTYTSDRPGDCPICNMKLVKKEMDDTLRGDDTHALREFTVEEIMNMKPGEICLLHKCKMGTC